MSNPWLDIPETDYVGHMSSPAVGQRPVLGRLVGETLETVRPNVVLVLGCSTGNGLEHVNPAVTSRVVVVDVNPKYLLRLRERFPNPPFELDVRLGDVIDIELEREAYDLVHAGLIFEYVEWPVLVRRVARALRPGGVLSVTSKPRPRRVRRLHRQGLPACGSWSRCFALWNRRHSLTRRVARDSI